jgi:hypothetical protein
LRQRAFGRRKFRVQERGKAAVPVGAGEPGGDAEGIVLVAGPALIRKLRLHSTG